MLQQGAIGGRRQRRLGPGLRPGRRVPRGQRTLLRVVPLLALAVLSFIVGIMIGAGPGRAEHRLVSNYVRAWTTGDFRSMYALLDEHSRARFTLAQFTAAYAVAAHTATLTSVAAGRIGSRHGDVIPVAMTVRTRLFGTLAQTLAVRVVGSGSDARIRFDAGLLFPGLRPGEQLARTVAMPPRAALLASDGTPLAEGPERASPIPDVAGEIVGKLGPIPADEARLYEAKGYPAQARVGLDGLERVFQDRLAGRIGGSLLAGRRVLAQTPAVGGAPVRTTITPSIERAAIAALGGRYGGIAAMDPGTGGLEALAGLAFSALQPPGSTMKMITATAALQAGLVKLTDTFPIATSATIEGYRLSNAGGEACGGTFLNAFAVSCNSVFAPLGVRVGATRLVAMAERFGFNHPVPIPGAAESSIPSAAAIGSDLAVGSSAIGQGKVLASALEMTDVGATIADGGRRPTPTLLAGAPARFVAVTSSAVAALVQRMMIAVVQYGTGTAAQIPGVVVAGKTGTAELRDTAAPGTGGPQYTDAWFVGYAPVGSPKLVVGALFPGQGAGGQTAAPAVREVLAAALGR